MAYTKAPKKAPKTPKIPKNTESEPEPIIERTDAEVRERGVPCSHVWLFVEVRRPKPASLRPWEHYVCHRCHSQLYQRVPRRSAKAKV